MLAALALGGAATVAAILIGDAPTVFAPIVAAFWTVLIALGTAALLTSRITLTSHEIVVRGLFIRQHRSRSRVTKAVRATIQVPRGANESLFLLDAHGKLLIRVGVNYYKREDVDRLIQTLGVPCTGPDYYGSAKEFTKTYPGLVSWAERHPHRIAFAIASAVLAVTIAAILISITTAA
ncbi:hypothetical protein ACH35V_21450 [Actinomadura sp. 1N219]|uniref:hypothetical protein n=1 Tax=Actinomadura sp. 1N219 TaxID=3375152 RepID=UPI00379141C0